MKSLKKKVQSNTRWKIFFSVAFFGDTISNLWVIDIFQKLVNSVTHSDTAIFKQSILLFIAALIINISFIILDQYFLRSVTNYGEMNLKKYTYYNYLVNVASSKNSNAGKIVSRINSDVPIISNWMSIGSVNSCLQTAYLIICLTLMLIYNVPITLVTIILIMVIFLLSRHFSVKEARYTKQLQNSFETISHKIYNSFLNMKTIKQLGKQDYFTKKVKKISIDSTEEQVKNLGKYVSLNEAMLGFMTDVLPLITFFLGILLNSMGKLSIGTALSIMLVAQKLNQPIIILAELIAEKKNAEQVYERISDMYEDNAEVKKQGIMEVNEFENYHVDIPKFGYEECEEQVLRDVRFTVNRGDLFVIKGESGRGKSTLLKLIAGFLSLTNEEAEIKYNNEDIRNLDPQQYYRHVLLAEQNSVIIEGSLEENILLGDGCPQEMLDEAVYVSKLNGFYEEKGADYTIKENGKNISGGEKQRINLARILLRNPEVLILDEITSNIDKRIRRELISRLMEYKKRRGITIIAVTHSDDFDCYCHRGYTL